eukprot:scaffold323_cov93-Cylindrotheca_fusiformis.AAC.4
MSRNNVVSKNIFVLGSFLVLAIMLVHQNGPSYFSAMLCGPSEASPMGTGSEDSPHEASPMGTGSEESPHAACQKMLDSFDESFDLRRTNRQIQTKRWNRLSDVNEKRAYDLFEPEAVCFNDERFGSRHRFSAFGDGPKFVCGADTIAAKSKTPEGCLVYSVGSNNKIDFEVAVDHVMGCETHTFDPTLAKPFKGGKYATFHPWGIGIDGEEAEFRNKTWVSKGIETIMNELGHSDRTLDILKIDCEGCEYQAMPVLFDAIAAGRVKVNQVQVELHGTLYPPVANLFKAADKAKMRIFHKERNHWGCHGYSCVEYALISEDFLREANKASVCGTANTG